MSAIVSWEYYNSLHNVVSNENDFARIEKLAEKTVAVVTGKSRLEGLTGNEFYYEQLQDCICNVIDKLVTDDTNGVGTGVSSVSNDEYSEHYAIATTAQRNAEMNASIRAWLSGTGLTGAY